MNKKDIENIVSDKLSGEILSAEESRRFDQWYALAANRVYYNSQLRLKSAIMASIAIDEDMDREAVWNRIRPVHREKTSLGRRLLRYSAVILPICIVAGYFLHLTRSSLPEPLPGTHSVTLTLSTGEEFALSGPERIFTDAGTQIVNDIRDGLMYTPTQTEHSTTIINTIRVPRGSDFKVLLSDGTVVWLNAESVISYPVSFTGGTREIKLEGEAFFDVASDESNPFVVHTSDYDVYVTGTQFNVRSYGSGKTATTLIEGRVRINKGENTKSLEPGQRAVLSGGGILIGEADIHNEVAWKDGFFSFTQARLADITEELARWYDLEVVYENAAVMDSHFSAWFRRNAPIAEIIDILGMTRTVEFRLSGNKLTVREGRH